MLLPCRNSHCPILLNHHRCSDQGCGCGELQKLDEVGGARPNSLKISQRWRTGWAGGSEVSYATNFLLNLLENSVESTTSNYESILGCDSSSVIKIHDRHVKCVSPLAEEMGMFSTFLDDRCLVLLGHAGAGKTSLFGQF